MFRKLKVEIERPSLMLYTDIVYANEIDDFSCHNTPLKMNFIHARKQYAPMEKLPLLIWAEGGAWRLSSPALRLPELSYYAYHGYAVADIQYAVTTERMWPAPVENIKTAIRYLKAHADSLGIDPDRICLAGESAGAHLTAVAGLTSKTDLFTTGEWSGFDNSVQAVINWYTPGDIPVTLRERGQAERACFLVQPEGELLRTDLDRDPARIAEIDPMTYVTPDAPPFLFFHGDADHLVPASASRALYDKLQASGVEADYYLVEGASHASEEFAQPAVQKIMLDFMDRHLK